MRISSQYLYRAIRKRTGLKSFHGQLEFVSIHELGKKWWRIWVACFDGDRYWVEERSLRAMDEVEASLLEVGIGCTRNGVFLDVEKEQVP